MQITIPHNGTESEGIARVKQLLDESREKIAQNATELKEEWQGNVLSFAFSAQGQHIQGTLTVKDRAFELYAKLPLALRLFEGTITRMIEAEAKKIRV
jgi:hypothetical protein